MRIRLLCLLVLALGFGTHPASAADAALRLPAIFSDHMVLQRDIRIPVWGDAAPGEGITVRFGASTAQTNADQDGHWKVYLDQTPANANPQKLIVQGKTTITFEDVLVGDVWVCSGQSNMGFHLGQCDNLAAVKPTADDPLLRLFSMEVTTSIKPQRDLHREQGKIWRACVYDDVIHFTAVGFFFGHELRKDLKIPIGLLSCSAGGSVAQLWTSVESIERNVGADPEFKQWLEKRQAVVAAYPQGVADYEPLKAKYDQESKRYFTEVLNAPDYLAKLSAWEEARKQAAAEGKPPPPRPLPSSPRPKEPPVPDDGPHSLFMVGNLYNGMLAPLMPFAIKGVIWYQGEANCDNAKQYRVLLPILIDQWRAGWGQGDFPFLVVQLPNGGRKSTQPMQNNDKLPWFREAQAQAAQSLPNTGLAVIYDVGDPNEGHPRDKFDVGTRLALIARRDVYGEHIVATGPVYKKLTVQGNTAWLDFDSVGSGLAIGVPPWTPSGIIPAPASELTGFAIAGADKVWVPAKATIENDRIAVSSDRVPQPVAVRYGWADDPSCNLYNAEKLPAAPFRTDRWQR